MVLGAGGAYLYVNYLIGRFHRINVNVYPVVAGKPFNILEIGSDSRQGLSGKYAQLTGAGGISGQRSDVVKIMHVDPTKLTVSVVSIPRDTLVQLLAHQNLYTRYNRINVTYSDGPNLLVKTIEANFGIPINHVVQVSFAGVIKAANAVGGVYLNFPYKVRDAYSRLHQWPGCHLIKDFQALAVVRSRHYEYLYHGVWYADGTSDYGRIQRQDAFIRALANAVKIKTSNFDFFAIQALVKALPSGVAIDQSWSTNEILGDIGAFRHFNAANMHSYTLPTTSAGYVSPYGDVLVVNQPAAQRMLVKIFGDELKRPTAPPPNSHLQPNMPPVIGLPKSTSTSTTHHKKTGVTTTTDASQGYEFYNPRPCTPK